MMWQTSRGKGVSFMRYYS